MFDKLEEFKQRYDQLKDLLSDPEVISDQDRYRTLSKEAAEISSLVGTFAEYKKISRELEDNKELLKDDDQEIREMARAEIAKQREQSEELIQELKVLMLPKDPNDEKNILLEIRAGTGGDEAALFAADIFRMYSRYAELKNWKVEVLSSNPTGVGGFKEIISLITGKWAYSRLKYESGVHRVQRVPTTESQGRIHTSAITVAVLPEAEDVELDISPEELRVDVYRSSGPGGQSVNTTDSAVRITHIPTGLVVTCQDEKSQHKNKAKAMKILRARLLDQIQGEQQAEISEARRRQVGSGDRSQRIRTYNFPQGRISDHRIGLTMHKLDFILEGNLDLVIDPLIAHFQAEALTQES
jgi:peptide chain release factor 1